MVPGNKPSLKTVSIKEDNNKDELDKLLDKPSLDRLKARFPKKIDEIFKISDAKLVELKRDIEAKDYTKVEEIIREELIEDDIDLKEKGEDGFISQREGTQSEEDKNKLIQNENMGSLDTITLGVKSKVIDNLKVKLGEDISKQIAPFNLKHKQKLNIIIGITGKILNSGVLNSFLNGTNNFITKILNGEFKSALKIGDKAGEFNNIIQSNLKDIISLLEDDKKSNTPIKGIEGFLSNPKKIGEYKAGDTIKGSVKLEGDDLKKYLLGLNTKVLGFDKKIQEISGMKEGMITMLSKTPGIMQKGVSELLGLLLKIPFIGELLAGLLGYDSPEKAIEGFGEEMKYANATNDLISFGGEFNNGIKVSNSTNSNTIEVLKDKNLGDLSYKKLIPFYKMCKNEGIDYTQSTIWSNLFNPITPKKGNEKFVILNTKLKNDPISEGCFNKDNNKPNEKFYKKLNNLKVKDIKKSKTKKEKTNKELINERSKLQNEIVSESDFIEGDGRFDFSKLDDYDLSYLKDNITLTELLGKDSVSLYHRARIGGDDFRSIEFYIVKIRKKLLDIKKVDDKDFNKKMLELTGKKDFNDITFGDLLNKNVLSKLYEKEINRKTEIDKVLDKKILLSAIKKGLKQNPDGRIYSFNYILDNATTIKIEFDSNKQEIKIGTEVFKIKLNHLNFGHIERKGDSIIIIPKAPLWGDVTDKKVTLTIDEFSNYMVTLKNDGKLELKGIDGEVIGSIEKTVGN